MKINKETRRLAHRLIRVCYDGSYLSDDKVSVLLKKLSEDKPRNYLALLNALKDLIQIEKAKYKATITSAAPLSEPEQANILAKIKLNHPHLESIEWKINPALIAGMTIQIGDEIIDGSIQSKLNQLTRTR